MLHTQAAEHKTCSSEKVKHGKITKTFTLTQGELNYVILEYQ